ncbi:MAG TPA: folate-binding protein [Solirubrobacterales bacterium]|nr:folate-binding protein [Solirubrobacterales bacterium]
MATIEVELDAEYRALREATGFLTRANRGLVSVTGPEAAELLQGQLTNDVLALEPGQGCYAALLNRKGQMQADMRVLRLAADELWLDAELDTVEAIVRHMQMFGVGREAQADDASADWVIVSVIGPGASEAAGVAVAGGEHAHHRLERDGFALVAVATDTGIDLIAPAADAPAVTSSLVAAGAVEVSEAAAEIVRVESGRPRFGREMTAKTIPAEAHINERAVSFTKGCYIGQETVARLHYKGKPNRHLRGLRLEAPAQAGDPVRRGERELGTIGTAVVSPAHGPVALAILRREAGLGDAVTVGDDIGAEIVDPPF